MAKVLRVGVVTPVLTAFHVPAVTKTKEDDDDVPLGDALLSE